MIHAFNRIGLPRHLFTLSLCLWLIKPAQSAPTPFVVARSTAAGAIYIYSCSGEQLATAYQQDGNQPHWPSCGLSLGTGSGVPGEFLAIGHVYSNAHEGVVEIYHLDVSRATAPNDPLGPNAGFTRVGTLKYESSQAETSFFGSSMAMGKFNEDAYPDLLVGSQVGAWLFRGKAVAPKQGFGFEKGIRILPGRCRPVARAGKVNNDGLDDFLVTIEQGDQVYLVLGKLNAEIQQRISGGPVLWDHLLESKHPNSSYRFGRGLAGGFDLDGDKRDDFIITESHLGPHRNSPEDQGDRRRKPRSSIAHIYLSSGLPNSGDWKVGHVIKMHSPAAHDGGLFGYTVASVGDVTGDGQPDLTFGDGHQRLYLFDLASLQQQFLLMRKPDGNFWHLPRYRKTAQADAPSPHAAWQLPPARITGSNPLELDLIGLGGGKILVGHAGLGANDYTGGGPGGAFLLEAPEYRGSALHHPERQLVNPPPVKDNQRSRQNFGSVVFRLQGP